MSFNAEDAHRTFDSSRHQQVLCFLFSAHISPPSQAFCKKISKWSHNWDKNMKIVKNRCLLESRLNKTTHGSMLTGTKTLQKKLVAVISVSLSCVPVQEKGKEVLGMELYPTGSSLPDCSHACGPCFPCKRVMVSFKCSIAESCPTVYRCMCKGKYYHVPSNWA